MLHLMWFFLFLILNLSDDAMTMYVEYKGCKMQDGILNANHKKLKSYEWIPGGKVRALVFVTHGYGEHLVPYYSELAERGCSQGFLVFGHDQVGHGFSEGEKRKLLPFGEYTGLIKQHIKSKRNQYPGAPVFLIGHSMGGLINLHLSLMPGIDGQVLMNPFIQPHPASASSLQILSAKVLSYFVPNIVIGNFELDDVTSDPYWKKVFVNDEYTFQDVTALSGKTSLQAMNYIESITPKISVPIFLLLGDQDKISYVGGSKKFFNKIGSYDKTIKIIENGKHHMFIEREPIRSQAFNEVWSWISSRVAPSPTPFLLENRG